MIDNAVIAPLWNRVCRTHHWRRGEKYPVHVKAPLTEEHLRAHLNGGTPIGACPITPGESTTRCALLDLDSHKGTVSWGHMIANAFNIIGAANEISLHPTLFRSSGGMGIHIYFLWKEPQDAYSVREALRLTLAKCGLTSGTGGIIKNEVEIFPKQDSVPLDGAGSMFILPLSGKSCALDIDGKVIPPEAIQWRGSHNVEVKERRVVERLPTAPAELAILKSALDAIPNTGKDELEYDQWRNVIFGIHSATGGSVDGLNLAHDFSARAECYNAEFLDDEVWPYVRDRDGGVTARTIFAMASQRGWRDPTDIDQFDVLPALPDNPLAAPPEGKSNPFETVSIEEFTAGKSPPWLVKGVLPQAALALVIGESGSGKTFFALDLVASISRGVNWRGLRVMAGRTVYICAEGVAGFRNRLRAYMSACGGEPPDLRVIPNAPNFMEVEHVKQVIAAVKKCGPVSVIVVDTMARVMPGANENAGEDMGKVLYHCDQLHRVTGALVVLVHHTGKDATKGARGHSSLKAAADCEIEITRNGHDRTATITKLKDGEDGAEFGFKLRTVDLGLDDDEEMVTSCVVEPADALPKAERARLNRKLGPDQQHLFDIASARQDRGDPLTRDAVIDEAVKALALVEGETKNQLRDMRRAFTALESKWGRFITNTNTQTFTILGREQLA